MMMTRLISALEGRGVGLGVNVGSGVKVGVMLGMKVVVASGVGENGDCVGISLGATYAVGEGTGGRELPQMFGAVPQPERSRTRKMRVRRFREFLQSAFVHG